METVGKFRLENEGGFVAKLQFAYDKDGKRVKSDKSGDITLGKSKTMTPAELNVPNGAVVTLVAFVVAGSDHESQEQYKFDANSNRTANYRISGTTLINHLRFDGIIAE